MSLSNKFNWNAIDDKQFEELIYEVVNAENPSEIVWRSNTGGKGRDIEAKFIIQGKFGEFIQETHFIEAKHHQKGVSPNDVADAFNWAGVETPTVLVIATSSSLINPCKDWVSKWQQKNPKIRVKTWERKDIESLILSKTYTRKVAVNFGLLPPFINDILPERPEEARINNIYPSIAYRYLMTEEEVFQIDELKSFLEHLGIIISKNWEQHEDLGEYTCFEITNLGIPNWGTFLSYLQAQIRLQITIMNYIFALESNASIEELQRISEEIKEKAKGIAEEEKYSNDEDTPPWPLYD